MDSEVMKAFDKQYPITEGRHLYYASLEEIVKQKAIFVPQQIWIKNFISKALADARREVITHLKYVFEEIEPYADRGRMLEYMDNYVKNCLGKDEKTTNKQTS